MPVVERISGEKHEGDVVCLAHGDNKLFSAGNDGKIRIWNNDLSLSKTIEVCDIYILSMAISEQGALYFSSYEGNVKYIECPYDTVETLFHSEDAIQAMYWDHDLLAIGDEKGVVTTWKNNKMLFKYNLVEEIKSLAYEAPTIYTVRDLDVVVSETMGKSGKYTTKAVLPGKSPLCLLGPSVDNKHSFLVFADRSGMGLCLANNLPGAKFAILWTLPNCHDMIVNALCGNDKYLFSGGYDAKVKGWTDLGGAQPTFLGEIDVGSCVNTLCCGPDASVYVGAADGVIRHIKF